MRVADVGEGGKNLRLVRGAAADPERVLAPCHERYILNEQIINPDGSITVRAVHLVLLGPNATGDVVLSAK